MKKLRIKKNKEKKLIWLRFRSYMDFVILACCLIIAFNIHPSSNKNADNEIESHPIMYIFHDYEWNEYIMNDKIHWSSDSWDYLFDDEIPNDLLDDDSVDSVSLGDFKQNENWDEDAHYSNSVKDNQVSLNDVMNELWLENDSMTINVINDIIETGDDSYYNVREESWSEGDYLIIEKIDNSSHENDSNDSSKSGELAGNNDTEDNSTMIGKSFTFIDEWWVLPTLVSRNDLYFNTTDKAIALNWNNYKWNFQDKSNEKSGWITIIDDYEDCTTPRWYKITHWDSVLAYQQKADTPDICDIERRFCWKWKLSGTYTQQWCSVNNNYTYEQWWDVKVTQNKNDKDEGFKWNIRQNPDGSVTVKDSWNLWKSRVSNSVYTEFSSGYNIRDEEPWVSQTSRAYRDCTTPWWEKVKHGQFVQAFKHENWFSDAPCEAQIRLCSMWDLMWTYTASTCKTRDTSFIDWVNGSPTRRTYSKEKFERVKKQIKNENNYYKKARKDAERSTDSDALDRILYILESD